MKKSYQKSSILGKYSYHYPGALIAQKPAHPRDSARLLVYDRKSKKVDFDTFRNLEKFLPKGAVLVFNQTKVVPARFTVTKPTGGKVVLLYIWHNKSFVTMLSGRKLEIGVQLRLSKQLTFTVVAHEEKFYILKPSFPPRNVYSVLELYGSMPIPPYIKHSPLSEKKLRQEYQTVFGTVRGSVAAPTAALHFTKKLLGNLKKQGFALQFVTLHVNVGTFAPVTEEQIKRVRLHEEWYEIKPKTARSLNKAKEQGRPIIAVGTTVVRTLESAARTRGVLAKLTGTTNLFIREGYAFKFVDNIITNFHVPKSSLLMLVSAFAGRRQTLDLYQRAIQKKFRLFSFGDGMLIK